MKRPAPELEELARAIEAITGSRATPGPLRLFEKYLDLLVTWNRTHGLTGLRSPGAIVRGLFLDSLLFLPLLPDRRPLNVLDLGTGAGIPGMPLRIVDAGIRLLAVEARRKRASFLSTVVRELRIDGVEIVNRRAEQVLAERPELRSSQDAVVARAAGASRPLIEISRGFLRPGGVLVASGSPPGGPPSPVDLLPPEAEWREVSYHALGLRRRFLVAINGS